MIDPETGWFEITQYNEKQVVTIETRQRKRGYIDIHDLY